MGSANTTAVKHPKYPERPATYDRLMKKQRPWRVVEVCLDMDAFRSLEDAKKRLGEAELALPKDLPPASRANVLTAQQAEVDEAQAVVDEATVQLLFEGIGRAKREALIDAHPPTQEDEDAADEAFAIQKANAARPEFVVRQKPQYNAKDFSVALIAASCVEPKMTEDEWREITDDWTDGEFQVLWMTALTVNSDGSLVSLGKSRNASTGTNGSAKS